MGPGVRCCFRAGVRVLACREAGLPGCCPVRRCAGVFRVLTT